MASSLSNQGRAQVNLSFPFINAADLTDAQVANALQELVNFSAGTGAEQVNKFWSDSRTLAGGANEDIDLSGSLVNALGETVLFTGVKVLFIRNNATTASVLQLKPGSATAMVSMLASGSVENIAQGGSTLKVNPTAGGFAVSAGSADKINLTNSDGSNPIDYDIFIVGIG